MNYQLLIESFSFGTTLSKQEIDLLNLELDTQIANLRISFDIGCLESAPNHICKSLNLRKGTFWITCLAETIDLHNPPKLGSPTKAVDVYNELLQNGLIKG